MGNKMLTNTLKQIDLNPKQVGNFYNLGKEMFESKVKESIVLLDGSKLYYQDIFAKEYENIISSTTSNQPSKKDTEFKVTVLNELYQSINNFIKKTVTINGKEFSKLDIAIQLLELDNTKTETLDYIEEHLYLTGNEFILKPNGNELRIENSTLGLLQTSERDEKYIKLLKKQTNLNIQNIQKMLTDKNCDLNKLYYTYKSLVNSMHENEKVEIFKKKYDRLEITLELIKLFPTIPFIYLSLVEILVDRKLNSITLINGNESMDFKQLFLMDLKNIHKKNYHVNFIFEKPFVELYLPLLEGLHTNMKGFNSTVIINGQTFTKLNIILNYWEIACMNEEIEETKEVENYIYMYFYHNGISKLKLPSATNYINLNTETGLFSVSQK